MQNMIVSNTILLNQLESKGLNIEMNKRETGINNNISFWTLDEPDIASVAFKEIHFTCQIKPVVDHLRMKPVLDESLGRHISNSSYKFKIVTFLNVNL